MARKKLEVVYDTLHRITQHPTAYNYLAPATKLQISCRLYDKTEKPSYHSKPLMVNHEPLPKAPKVPAALTNQPTGCNQQSYRPWTPSLEERKVVKCAIQISPAPPRVTTFADKGYSLTPIEVRARF